MQLALSDFRQRIPNVDFKSMGIPALVLLIIAMLIVPLPTVLLDILFTLNIMIALIVIMIGIHTEKPLDFFFVPSCPSFRDDATSIPQRRIDADCSSEWSRGDRCSR